MRKPALQCVSNKHLSQALHPNSLSKPFTVCIKVSNNLRYSTEVTLMAHLILNRKTGHLYLQWLEIPSDKSCCSNTKYGCLYQQWVPITNILPQEIRTKVIKGNGNNIGKFHSQIWAQLSKHHSLNRLVSGQIINCSSKYKV